MRTAFTFAVLLLVVACQPGPEDQTLNSPSQSTTMSKSDGMATQTLPRNPTMPPERDDPAGGASGTPARQAVHLIEYEIHLPQTVPAGRVAFQVANGGKEDHAFEIEGNGVHQQTQVLKRGNTTTLEANLPAGTYTVYCPVKGHKEKGMRGTLLVK